jgi:hypothetical protein
MFQFMRGIALVATMLLSCGASFAENLVSANLIMPGCRSFAAQDFSNPGLFDKGRCAGIVEAIAALAADVCAPSESTLGQTVNVVVKYIDDRPARMHENFMLLAREALQAAWPCRN